MRQGKTLNYLVNKLIVRKGIEMAFRGSVKSLEEKGLEGTLLIHSDIIQLSVK